MSNFNTYETERLIIRPTSVEDAAFIFELLNTPKWKQFIGDRNVTTVEEGRKYIEERMLPQLQKLGFSNNTVIRKSDGYKIGTCGLYKREGLDGVDIGFAFLPAYEKKGYAFEASNRIKQAAFEDFGITEILAITDKANVASQKLLSKLGLKLNGTTILPNETEELLLYQLTIVT